MTKKPGHSTAASHAAARPRSSVKRGGKATQARHRSATPFRVAPSRAIPSRVAPSRHHYAVSAPAVVRSEPSELSLPTSEPLFNAAALSPFFAALRTEQSRRLHPASDSGIDATTTPSATVRILQFGDSHTAADLFTGQLRARMQASFGDGGLGFQYPGHPFPGYHLAGSTRSQTSGWFTEGNHFTELGDGYLGLGGIAITARRPGESVTLSTTCTTLVVQYLRQPAGGRIRFADNGTFVSDVDTGTEAAAAFDRAPTAGANASPGGSLTYACTPGVHEFTLTTLDYQPVRLLGLVTEQPGVTYECLGINGAVASLMLRWNQPLFADFLRQRNPTLIVLAYGTNEAVSIATHNEEYVTQFNRLLANLNRIVPQAAILVLGPYDRAIRIGRGRHAGWGTFAGTERVIADQRESCRLHGCAFYDEQARMGGPGSMLRWAASGLGQGDHTHLTGAGYRVLADALYADLLAAYKSNEDPGAPAPAAPEVASPASATSPYSSPMRRPAVPAVTPR